MLRPEGALERALFAGDFKAWLLAAAGVTYDQRNAVVVGFALGFAVIPIIFTLAEDAFSNVPPRLISASLALGATRWQAARTVAIPAASPGLFAAVMTGFGRAVGETMIVLMATGNTPILSLSPFDGMRTMSACIAVELPEAPYGGSLYRVLILTALLLFAMTFVLNTAAVVVARPGCASASGGWRHERGAPLARRGHRPALARPARALLIALAMIVGLVAVVVDVAGGVLLAAPARGARRSPTAARCSARSGTASPTRPVPGSTRVRIKVGNRDLSGADFRWVRESEIVREPRAGRRLAARAARVRQLLRLSRAASRPRAPRSPRRPGLRGRRCSAWSTEARRLLEEERSLLRRVDRQHAPVARLMARVAGAQRRGADTARAGAAGSPRRRPAEDEATRPATGAARRGARGASLTGTLVMATADGREKAIPVSAIVRAVPANALSGRQKLGLYLARWWEFLAGAAARVEHRGRHLPGDLRHRPDGAADDGGGGAARRRHRGLPQRVRPRQGRSPTPCGSPSPTSPGCRRSCSAPSASRSSSTRSAAASTGCSSPTCCRRRRSAPAASCGPR